MSPCSKAAANACKKNREDFLLCCGQQDLPNPVVDSEHVLVIAMELYRREKKHINNFCWKRCQLWRTLFVEEKGIFQALSPRIYLFKECEKN